MIDLDRYSFFPQIIKGIFGYIVEIDYCSKIDIADRLTFIFVNVIIIQY